MKWSPQIVPGAGDTAVISGTDVFTIAVTGNRSIDTLVLDNPNATLRVAGQTFSGGDQLTVANGFENKGTIELDNEGSANGLILTVTTGTLTNAVGGIIRVPGDSTNGYRRLEAVLDNRGTLEVGAGLFLTKHFANSGTVHIPEGKAFTCQVGITWTHQGGTITGTGTLTFPPLSGSVLLLESDFTPGAYVLEALGLTVNGPGKLFGPPSGELRLNQWTINTEVVVSGDMRGERGTAVNGALSVLPGKTLRVVETIGGVVAALTVANGFENLGTIELASEGGSGNVVTLTVASGTLTNASGGVLRATAGAGHGVVTANLDNRGTVEATAGLLFRGNLANSGTVHLPEDQTLSLQLQTIWTHQGGAITGTGTLQFAPLSGSRLELESDFTPGGYVLEALGLTVNGPGKLLGPPTGELRMRQWTVNADVVVSGGMRVEGGTAVNGALSLSPGKTLRVVETIGTGIPKLTVASGFENHGIIELASEGGPGNVVTLTVVTGTLTNAPGGVLRATAGAGHGVVEANLDNRGTVEATAGLLFRGNLTNSGTVHIPEGKTLSLQLQTIWTHQGGAITGTGTLQFAPLSGSRLELESDFTPGAYVLNALGLTVNGPGKLLGPPTGELRMQQWTINTDLTVSGNMRVEGGTVANGALSVLAGKTLRVVETISGGIPKLTVANGFENHGIIELASEGGPGNVVTLTVVTGTLTNAPGGVLRSTAGAGHGLIKANLDNRGTVEATAGLMLRGHHANSGTVHIPEGKTLSLQLQTIWTHQGGAITGTGTLQFAPLSGSRLELESDFTPGGYVLEARGLTVNGPGKFFGLATGEFLIRDWTLNAEVVVSGDLRVEGNVNFNGALAVAPGKTLRLVETAGSDARLTVANGFENEGIIELTSEASVGRSAILTVTTGTLTNMVGGVIRVLEGGGGNRALHANLDNRGTVETFHDVEVKKAAAKKKNRGAIAVRVGRLTVSQTGADESFTNEGDVRVSAGATFSPSGGELINTATGTFSGSGEFDFSNVSATLEGTLAPGASPGTLSVTGNLPLATDAVLDLEIGGFTPTTEHDRLAVSAAANLGGTLRATLINGFFPKKDDAFTVLTYGSRTGTFATLDNPLPNRIAWEVHYGPTSAQLVVLNTAPTLAAVTNQTANEQTQLSVTASATDQDLPAQTMTYSLDTAPMGMTINPASGQITWIPTEAQGPGVFNVTVRVTDNGTPALGHSTSFSVTVNEVNVAPQLVLPGAQTVAEEVELIFTINGTDADLPANALTYELVSGPPGGTFNPTTREFRWTPTEAQGPDSYLIQFKVTDTNPPAANATSLSVTSSYTLTVNEVNLAPTLLVPANRTIHAGTALTVSALATDPDLPANPLSYSKLSGPAGVNVSAAGSITWNPSDTDANTTNVIVLRVNDNGVPNLSDTNSFVVTVNSRPVFTSLTKTGSGATAIWTAIPGAGYRLQYKTNLAAAAWSDVTGDVTASGATASKADATLGTNVSRFYRVFVLP